MSLVAAHTRSGPREPNDIVVTGAGMVTCLGLDRETTWQAVRQGKCGMGPLTALEQPLPPGKVGGQAPDLPSDESPGLPREVRYLRRVFNEALRDARLVDPPVDADAGANARLPYPPHRCATLLGTTLHGMRAGGEFLRTGSLQPLRQFLAANTLRAGAGGLGLEGMAATTCSACSSSLGSIALAVTLLREGKLDLVVAGGYDPISEYVYAGFNSLRLVSDGPLKPFARDRTGMKLAEGYALVVLERSGDAQRRGARPIARILGFGESADAHHLTQPHPGGDGAARAIGAALTSAGLAPADIDLVVAHATGTPDNDAGEYAALAHIFGADLPRVPVVGFKSHVGHTLGGAGAVELILSAMALRDGIVPPCANVVPEDCEFPGLSLATGAPRPATLRTSLNTSLGFGGANTCVVVGRTAATDPEAGPSKDDEPKQEIPPHPSFIHPTSSFILHPSSFPRKLHPSSFPREVLITGIGVVLPGAVGNDAFARLLTNPESHPVTADSGPIGDDAIAHLLNARRVRRMSPYVKLTLASTALAFQDAQVGDVPAFCESCSAILGSAHGSAGYSHEYYRQVVRDGIPAANPMLFAEGVPNAAAAHLSLMMSVKGACQAIIGSRTAGLDALRLAAARIAQGHWDRAIVSAGEEFNDLVNAAYGHCGLYGGAKPADSAHPIERRAGFFAGCGAVTLILESRESLERRGGQARGVIEATASAAPGEGREVEATARVLAELGDPLRLLSSANGTRIDRVEVAAIRLRAERQPHLPAVSSLYGHIPECFSVGPLAGIAAILLTGRLPRSFQPGLAAAVEPREIPDGEPQPAFGILCTDYAATVSGARVCLTTPSTAQSG